MLKLINMDQKVYVQLVAIVVGVSPYVLSKH
jgi:hypothetical protein